MDLVEQFPVLNRCTYLNTANSGILSKGLLEWRKAHDQDFLLNGSLFRLNKDEFLKTGRNTIAGFFKSHPDRTYLIPNFSHGFNIFLDGLDGPKRFLLFHEDYPSINYPVLSRGHHCVYVNVDEHLEQRILDAVKIHKPEVMAFSIVQYTNGLKIDLDFLKQLKANNPELLIFADGTQFCGAESFDFDQSGVDVLLTSGYKWLLGGYGNGIALLSAQAVAMLYTKAKKTALPTEGFLKDRNTLSLYFEPGHLDTLNFGTLFHAINYLQAQGMDNLENKTKQLALTAKQAFADRNLLSTTISNRKYHSSIFNLMLPPSKITKLQDNNIIFSSRGAGIRVSFYYYNSESDLDKLLQVIDN